MATLLPRQNVLSTAMDVKNTFSSWDGCMSKTYCKWPVIIGIIVGSLVVISILWCFMRCLCCGKDLVCCCFRCCGSSRPKGAKHLDSVPPTPYNNQYAAHPPPVYAGAGAFSQTATFEGKVHEDSLPAMPSWETATSRKIEVEEPVEAHEMERLGNSNSPNPGSGTISPPARPIPMRNGSGGPSSVPGSPRLPGFAASNVTGGRPSSPYTRAGETSGAGYGGSSPALAGPYSRGGDSSGAGGYGSSPAIAGPYSRGGDSSGAGGYGSTPAIAGPYGSRSDLQGSRSNLTQDRYGGGGYGSSGGNQGQSYGVDRYNNNNNSGYGSGRNSPYGGNSGTGGGYGRGNNNNSSYDYPSSNSNYDRYGGGGYGNSGSGNNSSSRTGPYAGQSPYGGGRGGAGGGYRDL